MASALQQLAGWAAGFRPERLPLEVLHRASLLILDSVACAIAAADEDNARAVLDLVSEQGGRPQCCVIGTGLRSPPPLAVLANCSLIRSLDYNDFMGLGKLGGHPSDNIGVALSVGEWQESSGRELLTAVVMGYELYGRLQELIDREQPWDHVTASGIVAPAIAGILMKLDATSHMNAMAISAAHCVTLGAIRTGHISSSKMLANALVAQTGTLAAMLAARGLTGPSHIFEAKNGMGAVLLETELSDLVRPCDDGFRIMDVAIKAYPSIGTSQAAVAAALKLRALWPSGSPVVERIEVTMADTRAVRLQIADEERRHPQSREAADHSFYFLIAVSLLDGELTPAQFAEQRWLDPAVCDLMAKMRIRVDRKWNDRAPGGFPCSIRIVTMDGEDKVVEVDYAPGHPRHGIGDDIVIDKFHRCARARFDSPRREQVIAAALSLKDSPSVLDFMQHLSVTHSLPGQGGQV